MMGLGWLELFIIAVIIIVIFAAGKVPELLEMLKLFRKGSAIGLHTTPPSDEYFTQNIPASWAIRKTLISLSHEVLTMHKTLDSARSLKLPETILHSYQEHVTQATRILNQNADRIVHVARAGSMSPQLEEVLSHKNRSFQALHAALVDARGTLSAVMVTGLEDQRDLDRVTRSLRAWSEALNEVSVGTMRDSLPL